MKGNGGKRTGCLGALGMIALIFLLAAFVHHVSHSCPQGYIPGTPHWCR